MVLDISPAGVPILLTLNKNRDNRRASLKYIHLLSKRKYRRKKNFRCDCRRQTSTFVFVVTVQNQMNYIIKIIN